MQSLLKVIFLSGIVSSSTLFATGVHTTHTISVLNDAKWNIRITEIAPDENAYFSSGSVSSPVLDLIADKNNPAEYGFGFGDGTDFNVSYTITAIDQSTKADASQHKTRSCTFVVGANGPANPNIKIENYQGANCSYKVIPGQGEDFTLNSNT